MPRASAGSTARPTTQTLAIVAVPKPAFQALMGFLAGIQPMRPVIYASVRLSLGLVNRISVGLNSARMPSAMRVGRILIEHQAGRHVADTPGLLHVMGDDHDRVVFLEVIHQVFDTGG